MGLKTYIHSSKQETGFTIWQVEILLPSCPVVPFFPLFWEGPPLSQPKQIGCRSHGHPLVASQHLSVGIFVAFLLLATGLLNERMRNTKRGVSLKQFWEMWRMFGVHFKRKKLKDEPWSQRNQFDFGRV